MSANDGADAAGVAGTAERGERSKRPGEPITTPLGSESFPWERFSREESRRVIRARATKKKREKTRGKERDERERGG